MNDTLFLTYRSNRRKITMREKLKEVWRNILKKEYSEDTIAAIMSSLAHTNTPQETLDKVVEILNKEMTDEQVYQAICQLIKN